MPNAKIGMRGTSSWAVTGERPESWRQGISYLFPNGMAPLTAILSKTKGEMVSDPHYHWFTQNYINKGAALVDSGVYTDSGLGTALSATSSAAGSILAAKVSAEFASYVKAGNIILLRQSIDHSNDMQAIVISVVRATDSNSSITFSTLKTDGSGNGSLVNADRVLIIGSAYAEGSNRPEAIQYVPVEHSGYTQIFRTSLSQTRTAMRTKLRTEDAYKKAKKEALQDHTIEIEDAFIHGVKTLGTGANGQPLRTTDGIIQFVRTNYPTNVLDFRLDSNYSGQSWAAAGKDFINNAMEQSFRWGNSMEKLVFTGNGGMLAIQSVVENNSMYMIKGGETRYGIKVTVLETPFGTWNIKTHPRFTHETSNTNAMLVFEPEDVHYRYITDTQFQEDQSFGRGGGSGVDGKNEEFLTECGLEMHHPEKCMYLSNISPTMVNTA